MIRPINAGHSGEYVGRVISAHGRQYRVLTDDGESINCFPRGKKSELAVGDRVRIQRQSEDQAVVVACLPRTSLLYRSDPYRQKLIAANATQIVIVVATTPGFSIDLVSRCLIAAESQSLKALVVLNKCDLREHIDPARSLLQPLLKIGTRILEISAKCDASALLPLLAGEASVLVGQSGMGKSTLVNALVPGAMAATREISVALGSGRHTTTHATYYTLDADTALIDSPGLQEFGLAHLDRQTLSESFVEFRPHLGNCRFRDCCHRHEPNCALLEAKARGEIDPVRMASYYRLCDELPK
ncbi:MAG TPA: ribosome small subunit-dependent GTPase A [Rhodocyclaceae bacterium]